MKLWKHSLFFEEDQNFSICLGKGVAQSTLEISIDECDLNCRVDSFRDFFNIAVKDYVYHLSRCLHVDEFEKRLSKSFKVGIKRLINSVAAYKRHEIHNQS